MASFNSTTITSMASDRLKNACIGILIGSALVLAALSFSLRMPAVESDEPLVKENRSLRLEVGRQRSKADEASAALAVHQHRHELAAIDPQMVARQRRAGAIPSLLEHRETVAMAWAALRAAQMRRYAALFQRLGLSVAERDQVAALLAEHSAGRYDAAMLKMGMRADASAGDRQKLDQELTNNLIRLLGADRAAAITMAEKQGSDWDAMQSLQDRLVDTGEPLQPAQFDALMSLWKPRKAPVPMTPEETEQFFAMKTQNNAQMLEQARAFLTPAQAEVFSQQLAENLTGIRVNVYMMQFAFQNAPRRQSHE
jgi:hypothetical protein